MIEKTGLVLNKDLLTDIDVFLVSPASLRQDLYDDYRNLIKEFLKHGNKVAIFCSEDDEFMDILSENISMENVFPVYVAKELLPMDIWIRDFFPIYSKKTSTLIQPVFAPSYIAYDCLDARNNRRLSYEFFIETLSVQLSNHLNYMFVNTNLDGGAMVKAKTDDNKHIIFVSRQALSTCYNKTMFLNVLKKHFDYVCPVNSSDAVLKHIDHQMLYINADITGNALFFDASLESEIVNYAKQYKWEIELYPVDMEHFNAKHNIFNTEAVECIKYPHLNFLQIKQNVFIGCVNDCKSWFEDIGDMISSKTGLTPVLISLDRIHYWGGSIHCVTWNFDY